MNKMPCMNHYCYGYLNSMYLQLPIFLVLRDEITWLKTAHWILLPLESPVHTQIHDSTNFKKVKQSWHDFLRNKKNFITLPSEAEQVVGKKKIQYIHSTVYRNKKVQMPSESFMLKRESQVMLICLSAECRVLVADNWQLFHTTGASRHWQERFAPCWYLDQSRMHAILLQYRWF